VIETDPLVGARGHVSIEAPGSRAATLDEARAFLAHAAATVMTDARAQARCNRAVYYLCLFAAGCRVHEPARWRWKNLALDHDAPHVLWTSGRGENRVHKNNRLRAIALAPELVSALVIWRDQLADIRKAKGLGPLTSTDLVFPSRPINATFRRDRELAGVARLDFRERVFSAHSARKFLATQLTACGVTEKMVDFLMRHTGRTEFRYYDPSLAEQAAAIAKLPKLMPDFFFDANLSGAKLLRSSARKNAINGLDKQPEITDDISVTTADRKSQNTLPGSAGPCGIGEVVTDPVGFSGPALSSIANTAAASAASSRSPISIATIANSGFGMNETGDNERLARLLEALAEVIRGR
jgi:hypothetical protein